MTKKIFGNLYNPFFFYRWMVDWQKVFDIVWHRKKTAPIDQNNGCQLGQAVGNVFQQWQQAMCMTGHILDNPAQAFVHW